MQNNNNLFQSYLLPLLLTLLLILVSLLLDIVNLTNIAMSALLFAIIGTSVFLAELLIVNVSRSLERKNTFAFVSNLLLANRSSEGSNILTLDEVFAIESASDEVWIYAYDLGWEEEGSKIPDLVFENLKRGVKYRYLVPNNKQTSIRVSNLTNKYRRIRNSAKLIEFRSRPRELKLVQFGIAVYNPSVTTGEDRSLNGCVVVFYPHYQLFGPNSSSRFLSMRGKATLEVQEGFIDLWDDAIATQKQ